MKLNYEHGHIMKVLEMKPNISGDQIVHHMYRIKLMLINAKFNELFNQLSAQEKQNWRLWDAYEARQHGQNIQRPTVPRVKIKIGNKEFAKPYNINAELDHINSTYASHILMQVRELERAGILFIDRSHGRPFKIGLTLMGKKLLDNDEVPLEAGERPISVGSQNPTQFVYNGGIYTNYFTIYPVIKNISNSKATLLASDRVFTKDPEHMFNLEAVLYIRDQHIKEFIDKPIIVYNINSKSKSFMFVGYYKTFKKETVRNLEAYVLDFYDLVTGRHITTITSVNNEQNATTKINYKIEGIKFSAVNFIVLKEIKVETASGFQILLD